MFGFVKEVFRGGNRFIFGISVIAALGGFLFGYDTGVISGALLFIKQDFALDQLGQQWVIGSLLVGAVAGAAISAYSADLLSRKWTKLISGIIYVVAALSSAIAPNLTWLLVSRFILGLAVGTASFVAPMYIAEQTPAKIRGGTVSFNQLMVTLGILVAYFVDFLFKGVPNNWRWMLGLGALPGLALAIGMLCVPHTPRWLMQKDREDEARNVLKKSRNTDEIDDELAEIHNIVSEHHDTSFRRLFTARLRPLMIIGLALAIFQQLIGVNTVIYFSATILKYTGINTSQSIGEALFVGITNVVFTVIAILLLDRIGRRTLLITGTIGGTASLVLLGVYFFSTALQQAASWVGLVALVCFMASFAIGLGPVFWLMISEIFPLGIRSKAMSVCTIANWTFNFLISYFFLALVSGIGKAGTFWLYAGFGTVATIFFALRVPETKDRTLEEIESDIGGKDVHVRAA